MSTYGFHTVHGRAPAIATGVKLANPELDVWVMTGDGDGLSIGGNHMLHVLRRNVDLQIILFNNEIYGLTKGQYSPTSRTGTRSPTSPTGSIERPLSAATFALGAGGRFVARGIDTQQVQLIDVLKRAHGNRGASFVEIFQNCLVFNDGVFDEFTDRAVAEERQLHVVHGQPLLFGKGRQKGLRFDPSRIALDVVTLGRSRRDDGGHPGPRRNQSNAGRHARRARAAAPGGAGRPLCRSRVQSYTAALYGKQPTGTPDVEALLHQGKTWTV